MDLATTQKRSLQQIYGKLSQSAQSLALGMTAYNKIAGSALFDPEYYQTFYPDVQKSGLEPLAHYILHGAAEGRSTHPLFDGQFYLRRLSLRNEPKPKNGLQHFLETSNQPGNNPSPLFDSDYFQKQHRVPLGKNPVIIFLAEWKGSATNPTPLFDMNYYLASNLDVKKSGVNPLLHFLLMGAFEGRSPHPLFDTEYYLRRLGMSTLPIFDLSVANPLVALYQHAAEVKSTNKSLVNGLIHFLEFGKSELRDPHCLFSSEYYMNNFMGECESGLNPLVHYITEGARNLAQPHLLFDPSFYLRELSATEKDAAAANPLIHFILNGHKSRVSPHRLFDADLFLNTYPEIWKRGSNPLIHYLTETVTSEQRITSELFDGEFYTRFYPDVVASGHTALEHYILYGERESRLTTFLMLAQKNGIKIDRGFKNPEEIVETKSEIEFSEKPIVTVILHGHLASGAFERCRAALIREVANVPVEIFYVAEDEIGRDELESSEISLVAKPTRENFKAVIESAKGDILLFLKTSMVVLDDFFLELVGFFGERNERMLVSPKVFTQNGRLKCAGYKLREDAYPSRVRTFQNGFDYSIDHLEEVDACLREAFAIRTRDFLALGGFDEYVGEKIYQDIDLCIRARASGFKIWNFPQLKALTLREFARAEAWEPLTNSEDLTRAALVIKLQEKPLEAEAAIHSRARE